MARIKEFAGTDNDSIGASGNHDGGDNFTDPASLSGSGTNGDSGTDSGTGDDYDRDASGTVRRNKDGSPRRKRGRKAGTVRSPSSHSSNLKGSVDALSGVLLIIHAGLAGVTNTPELVIDKEEGDKLASATVPVLDLLDFAPDPRFIAVFGLLAAGAQVYGPRIYLIRHRMQQEKDDAMKRAKTASSPASPNNAPDIGGLAGTVFDANGNPIGLG